MQKKSGVIRAYCSSESTFCISGMSFQDSPEHSSSSDPSSVTHFSTAVASSESLAELDLDEGALDMEPILKPHPKMLSLDEKSILTVAKANVLSQITVSIYN